MAALCRADRHLTSATITPAHAEVAAEVLAEQHFETKLTAKPRE
jgi:hypothetical protein